MIILIFDIGPTLLSLNVNYISIVNSTKMSEIMLYIVFGFN